MKCPLSDSTPPKERVAPHFAAVGQASVSMVTGLLSAFLPLSFVLSLAGDGVEGGLRDAPGGFLAMMESGTGTERISGSIQGLSQPMRGVTPGV